MSETTNALAAALAHPEVRRKMLAGDSEGAAQAVETLLTAADAYLMHWPEKRAPARMELTSLTAAGPIEVEATDLDGMGARMVIGAKLTAMSMLLNLPYSDMMKMGAWLLARAVMADKRVKAKDQVGAVPTHGAAQGQ